MIACVALAVALGGTSYAALSLPANSVGTKQLKRNAVIGSKVKPHSLTGRDIDLSTLGRVPLSVNAAHASSADTATTAADASRAANADQLGGLAASAYQQRVTGVCRGFLAVQSISADGTVTCARPQVTTDDLSASANGGNGLGLGSFDVSDICHNGGATKIRFSDTGPAAATLNWFYSDGTTTYASGNSLAASTGTQDFDFAGKRIEGQFIFWTPNDLLTVNLHAFDAGTGCEVFATVEGFYT
jgi:hypothetical protein